MLNKISRSVVVSKKSRSQYDGAGANVHRTIGAVVPNDSISPFLMLDEFFVSKPAGFPSHPHRGFETVTYMLDGSFHHKDNKGNEGTIRSGDVQWMTAGKGVIHSEMPGDEEVNHGLQLWINLKAKDKMIEPNYQDLFKDDIPEYNDENGSKVRVIAGNFNDKLSASVYTRTPTLFFDISLTSDKEFIVDIPSDYNAFFYVLEGTNGYIGDENKETLVHPHHIVVLDSEGDHVRIKPVFKHSESDNNNDNDNNININNNNKEIFRCVLIAGEPIDEPICQHGPFVMNTREEIVQAFDDYQSGKF